MMFDPSQIVVSQIITEKSLGLKVNGVYTFRVLQHARKTQIKDAVEKLFNVEVISVNTTKVLGKKRIAGKSIGRTAGWKKAYVQLKKGQKIKLLEEIK